MVSMAYSKSWWKWVLMLLFLLVNLGFECSALGGNVLAEGPGEQQVFPDKVEIDALFSLRSSLGLRSKEWPKKVNPCTRWVGITCDSGHVVAINLTGFRRTVVGSRNPKFSVEGLQNLTYLQSFIAPGFALPGSIPPLFGQLTALKVLSLSSPFINGEIPPSIGNASNLSVLVLSGNNLTGSIPLSLEKLAGLSILDLSFNKLDGLIPSEFANLKNLTSLNLSGNNINGSIPSELGNLFLLNELDLGSNALSGTIPKELGNLRSLRTLVLADNHLNGSIPEEIFNCTALETLRLDQNNLTDALPNFISKLVNITELNISNNLFYKPLPTGLSSLPNLLAVDLSYNFFENRTFNVSPPRMFIDDKNCLQQAENQRSIGECSSFYAGRGLSFSGFGETNSSAPPPMGVQQSGGKNKHLAPILGGVFGGLGFVLLVILLVLLYLKYERKVDTQDKGITPSVRRGGQSSVGISVNLSRLGESFTYEQLSQATEDFSASNLIKNGHSGDLYQGLLEGGVPIVVKRINLNTFKKDGYHAELDILGRASHTRLVPLLGHCLEREDEKLLVYKYMPYRDLSYALYKKGSSPEDTLQSLDWITRLKIAIGAAEGLSFLHHECSPPVVHRDVQASSILLDDKFEVRLGSLTEACLQEGEAQQSVIARLLRISQTSEQGMSGTPVATCAYDVYCFGKVLMELVSGKLGISGSSDPSAFTWLEGALPLINIYEKESVTKIVDPSLIVDEDLLEEVWAMAIVAKSCLNPKPSKRPLMRYILKALENPLKVVREDNANASARLRTSSHGSWNAALFGSWRHSSSEIVAVPGPLREEYSQKGPLKQGGTAGSQGSGGQGGDVSSHRRLSNEIFPEPMEEAMVQASSTDIEKQED